MVKIAWVQWKGKWYYLDGGGAMWYNAWTEWKGVWYYLGSDGGMLTNTVTPDGYTVNADGSWNKAVPKK